MNAIIVFPEIGIQNPNINTRGGKGQPPPMSSQPAQSVTTWTHLTGLVQVLRILTVVNVHPDRNGRAQSASGTTTCISTPNSNLDPNDTLSHLNPRVKDRVAIDVLMQHQHATDRRVLLIERTVEQRFKLIEDNMVKLLMLEKNSADILDQIQRDNRDYQTKLSDYLKGKLTKTHAEIMGAFNDMRAQGQSTAEAVDRAQRTTDPAMNITLHVPASIPTPTPFPAPEVRMFRNHLLW